MLTLTWPAVVALIVIAIVVFSRMRKQDEQISQLRKLVHDQKRYVDELYAYIVKHLKSPYEVPSDSSGQAESNVPGETAYTSPPPAVHTEILAAPPVESMPPVYSQTVQSVPCETPIEVPAGAPAEPSAAPPIAAAPIKYEMSANSTQANQHSIYSLPTVPYPAERKSTPKNENWVGINLLNRIGALLIIIGAIATAAFEGFHPVLRTSILFAFATAVLVLGEVVNRKKPTTFSIGVSATGMALIYVAIAASYFGLQTLNMYAALIACVLATALGVFLATRYKAQVIGIFALVGGYLPIFALNPENYPVLIGLVTYFVLLSLFSLILALTRKWSVMNFIGLGLTVISVVYLGLIMQADALTSVIYACFAFLIYSALPLISVYRTKEKFGDIDFWLIVTNTFISSIVIFLIAGRLNIQNLHAFLCLGFAAVYAGAAVLLKYKFDHKNMQTIFTLISIAFCVLFVPFFFNYRWFSVMWLMQGVTLASYGVLRKHKIFEFSGLSILGFSAIALLHNSSHLVTLSQFTFDYTFFTAGALAVFGCYLAKGRHGVGYEQAFKIIAFTNLWLYAMHLWFYFTPLDFLLNPLGGGKLNGSFHNSFTNSGGALITFALAFLYAKVKLWTGNGTKVLANVLHFAGIITLAYVSMWHLFYGHRAINYISNTVLISMLFASIIGFALIIHYHLTENRNRWTVLYKNINILGLWLVLIGIIGSFTRDFVGFHMILILITFAIAFTMTRIPAISDNGAKILALKMYVVGFFWLWIFNSLPYIWLWESNSSPYGNVPLLIIVNAFMQVAALFVLNDALNLCNVKARSNPIKIPILSAYFLLAVTQTMMVQADVAFYSAVISIKYAVAAFAWIIVGFKLKNKPVRKAGLVLSMASVAKLLVIDTWGLSTEMRIVSYISLGLILMLISFVYQKLSKSSDG